MRQSILIIRTNDQLYEQFVYHETFHDNIRND